MLGVPVLMASVSVLLAGCVSITPVEDPLAARFPEQADLAKARVQCLNEKGWDAELTDDGGIRIALPDQQRLPYFADNEACLQELGIDLNRELTGDEMDAEYEWYVDAAECLRHAGWPISPAPSRATFGETYNTSPWMPWDEVPIEQTLDALTQCPMPEPVL
jgi:hypothetical protein